jgi:hypothetical protein
LTIGNAFDITADLYATSRQSFSNGGYRADMNLTITNHKPVPANILVKFNTYYGNNLSIKWDPANPVAGLSKYTAN